MRRMLAWVIAVLFLSIPALAVEPDEILDDPALEARARDLSAGLRCLVCQNQSIDDSNAELARDLRVLVRERLVAGDSDDAVIDYVVSRYGEYVLLNPVMAWHTLVLWFAAPGLLLIGAGAIAITVLRRRKKTGPGALAALSPDEKARLDALLSEPDH